MVQDGRRCYGRMPGEDAEGCEGREGCEGGRIEIGSGCAARSAEGKRYDEA